MLSMRLKGLSPLLLIFILVAIPSVSHAEEDQQREKTISASASHKHDKKKNRRNYLTETNLDRSDAGIFHVGFALGGNFYIEPQISSVTGGPLGDYFRDFGFQAGIYFDYDYSEAEENIPLLLRGMLGYKYILNSVHVFAFDGVVRHNWKLSEKANFGLGGGVSAAVWYRAVTTTSPTSQLLFLPSLIANAGFDFHPFMVDLKWLVNRMGSDATILGFELYFGVRL